MQKVSGGAFVFGERSFAEQMCTEFNEVCNSDLTVVIDIADDFFRHKRFIQSSEGEEVDTHICLTVAAESYLFTLLDRFVINSEGDIVGGIEKSPHVSEVSEPSGNIFDSAVESDMERHIGTCCEGYSVSGSPLSIAGGHENFRADEVRLNLIDSEIAVSENQRAGVSIIADFPQVRLSAVCDLDVGEKFAAERQSFFAEYKAAHIAEVAAVAGKFHI